MSYLPARNLQAQETFEDFLKKQKRLEEQQGARFDRYKDSVTAAYQRFLKQDREAFDRYLGEVRKKWGKKNAATSTRKDWVAYEEDYGARRRVNFEKGEASVEVLVTRGTPPEVTRKRIQQEIVNMISDRGDRDPLEVKQSAPSPNPVLAGQLRTTENLPVSPANAEKFADEVLLHTSLRSDDVLGADGMSRTATRVTFKLVPNHLRVRAEQFRVTVARNAGRFGVDAPLVFAVMHTESYFNPRAKSSAPAYGLMQLVPQSGARAAHVYVYGADVLLTPEYLFDPANNVELGTGYLSLLMTKDFKEIREPLSRKYCAIAAYNTGSANVASAFTGKRKLPEALARINDMTPEQVFARLRSSLPFVETREYLKDVNERIELYEEWR